ncbi:hypothetical protein HRG14_27290, partial [Paenibacillus dendritiformis]|nr:hypothetical protein [Paenibacillus dendritiformis]
MFTALSLFYAYASFAEQRLDALEQLRRRLERVRVVQREKLLLAFVEQHGRQRAGLRPEEPLELLQQLRPLAVGRDFDIDALALRPARRALGAGARRWRLLRLAGRRRARRRGAMPGGGGSCGGGGVGRAPSGRQRLPPSGGGALRQ